MVIFRYNLLAHNAFENKAVNIAFPTNDAHV